MHEIRAQEMSKCDPCDHLMFRSALAKFTTGVTVITTNSPSGPIGITVNSFSSVSLDPPLVLWSLDKSSNRLPVFKATQNYAIHVMAIQQKELCMAFIKDAQAFDTEQMKLNANNVPIMSDCLARFECCHHAIYEGGDHLIFVGLVQAASSSNSEPLIFFDSTLGAIEVKDGLNRGK